MADYGYFGKGAEGYAHYSQTFKSTFPNSSSGRSSYHGSTVRKAEPTAAQKPAEQRATYNKDDYTDQDLTSATMNALFGVGMFALAVAIFMAIFLSV